MAKGAVRNTFSAGSLWFLTCLFVMEAAFKLLKHLKNGWLILFTCWCAYCIGAVKYMKVPEPSWWYNVDSVLIYIIYFAIGYITYPYIIRLFELNTIAKKAGFAISGVLTLIYSLLRFEGVDPLAKIGEILVPFGGLVSGIWNMLATIIGVLLLVWFNLVAAKLLENVTLFTEIGRETLYLCGNEDVIKTVAANALSCVGISLNYPNPLSVYLYSFFLLVITAKWLTPLEKGLVTRFGSGLEGLVSDVRSVLLKR